MHWSARTELVNIFTVHSVISCLLEQIKFVFQWEYCGRVLVFLSYACNVYVGPSSPRLEIINKYLNSLFYFSSLVLSISYFSCYGIIDLGPNQAIFSKYIRKNGLTIFSNLNWLERWWWWWRRRWSLVATKNTINWEVVTRGFGLNLTKQIIPPSPPSCYSVHWIDELLMTCHHK